MSANRKFREFQIHYMKEEKKYHLAYCDVLNINEAREETRFQYCVISKGESFLGIIENIAHYLTQQDSLNFCYQLRLSDDAVSSLGNEEKSILANLINIHNKA